MASTVGQPSITGRHPQGLRPLSADLTGKANDDTATQITRIGLTFVGTVAFCLLSLLSPDSALLGGSEKLNLPFAGPVSFFGFMLFGPTVLIVQRVYLQIYVEHRERLDRMAQRMAVVRAPTLVPLKNPLIRTFSCFAFYFFLPLTMLLFARKAAVFPAWGSGLLCVSAAVIAIHLTLLRRDAARRWPRAVLLYRFSWRSVTFVSVGAAIVALGVMAVSGAPRRPFNLFRANLTDADLRDAELSDANLSRANLSRAYLLYADLTHADLSRANLTGAYLNHADLTNADLTDANLSTADLSGYPVSRTDLKGDHVIRTNLSRANLSRANLTRADLHSANLNGADLGDANLTGADLSSANLSDTRNLTQGQLDAACGKDPKLPPGLILNKLCPAKSQKESLVWQSLIDFYKYYITILKVSYAFQF